MSKNIDVIDDTISRIQEVMGLCSDPTRFAILRLFLERSELNAGEIAGRFRLARATVSHHVNLLVRGRVLTMRKEGQERWYAFQKEYVLGVLESFLAMMKRCC